VEKSISELRAREVQVGVLEKRVSELEIENRRLWGAMRSTGELLQKLLHDDEPGA
jgi:hypothetical protein